MSKLLYADGHLPFCPVDRVWDSDLEEFVSVGPASSVFESPSTGFVPAVPPSLSLDPLGLIWPRTPELYGYGNPTLIPSQSSAAVVRGIGPNTTYPIGLTLEQVCKLYWQVRDFQTDFGDSPLIYNVIRSFEAAGFSSTGTVSVNLVGSFGGERMGFESPSIIRPDHYEDLVCGKAFSFWLDEQKQDEDYFEEEDPYNPGEMGLLGLAVAWSRFQLNLQIFHPSNPLSILKYNDLYWPYIYISGQLGWGFYDAPGPWSWGQSFGGRFASTVPNPEVLVEGPEVDPTPPYVVSDAVTFTCPLWGDQTISTGSLVWCDASSLAYWKDLSLGNASVTPANIFPVTINLTPRYLTYDGLYDPATGRRPE